MLFQFDKDHSYLPGKANLAEYDTNFSQVPQPPKSATILFVETNRTFGKTIFCNWIYYCFVLKNSKPGNLTATLVCLFVSFYTLDESCPRI